MIGKKGWNGKEWKGKEGLGRKGEEMRWTEREGVKRKDRGKQRKGEAKGRRCLTYIHHAWLDIVYRVEYICVPYPAHKILQSSLKTSST